MYWSLGRYEETVMCMAGLCVHFWVSWNMDSKKMRKVMAFVWAIRAILYNPPNPPTPPQATSTGGEQPKITSRPHAGSERHCTKYLFIHTYIYIIIYIYYDVLRIVHWNHHCWHIHPASTSAQSLFLRLLALWHWPLGFKWPRCCSAGAIDCGQLRWVLVSGREMRKARNCWVCTYLYVFNRKKRVSTEQHYCDISNWNIFWDIS